ncbi:MAG: FecR domain-containing protein, partial [Myxococcota bacterium]
MTERLPDGFLDALHEADEHIQRTTPPRQEARDRLLRELRAEAERPAPLALLTPPQWGALAAAAAVAVAFGAARFMVSDHGSTSPPPPRDAAPVAATQDASWAGEGLSSSTCAGTAAPERGATKLGEGCTFAWLEADAELVAVGEVFVSKRAERELQVHGGTMRFTIDHERDKTTPVLVHVSGGTIEVVGTVFVVSEDAEAKTGHVSLERGAITFTNTAGEVTTLAPGDSLSWGDPPSADESAAPQDQDAAPTPTPT